MGLKLIILNQLRLKHAQKNPTYKFFLAAIGSRCGSSALAIETVTLVSD